MENLKLRCAACGDSLDAESEACSNCGAQIVSDVSEATNETSDPNAMTTNNPIYNPTKNSLANDADFHARGVRVSTLIEFPGVAARPQWRKDLSERVREIQKKRALEAEQETSEAATDDAFAESTKSSSLGLVPPVEPQPVNPIVEKALKRLERARQTPPPAPPSTPRIIRGERTTATATAQAMEAMEAMAFEPEQIANSDAHPQIETDAAPLITSHSEEQKASPRATLQMVAETPPQVAEPSNATDYAEEKITSHQETESRQTTLVVVPNSTDTSSSNPPTVAATSIAATETATAEALTPTTSHNAQTIIEATPRETVCEVLAPPKQTPRRVCPTVIDDAYLARREAETLARYQVEKQNDKRAPLLSRFAASIVDWIFVLAISASIVFLLYPLKMNLHDARLFEMTGGVAIALGLLYSIFALTLAGRTFGMKLFGLSVVNARDGFTPTFFRSLLRAFSYLFALGLCGFGIFYALIDDERRALHDHFAGTIVLKTVAGDGQ